MIEFNSVQELIDVAENKNTTISQIALEQTTIDMQISETEIKNKMLNSIQVMKDAIKNGLDKNIAQSKKMTEAMAYKFKKIVGTEKNISGNFIGQVITNALAISETNAAMGKIVAAPTAGSCGIIPACLLTLQKHLNLPDEKIVMGLINSSAIGMVIAKKASISGAEGGCQAECGSASAMAASAMTELLGGTPKMCADAIAHALKSLMGLICDPVAGLVEEPCIIRNASCATIAVISCEYALAQIKTIIPVDEVIEAMNQVGKQMPSCLKETAEGGVAASCSAKKFIKIFLEARRIDIL